MSALTPSRSFSGLRHGATDWNRQGLFQGRTDNPLNEDGLRQAHEAASLLRDVGIGRIVASPLVRAANRTGPSSRKTLLRLTTQSCRRCFRHRK